MLRCCDTRRIILASCQPGPWNIIAMKHKKLCISEWKSASKQNTAQWVKIGILDELSRESSLFLPWTLTSSSGNKASRYLAPIMCFLCVFFVSLWAKLHVIKGSLPLDCKISLPVHSTSRMLPVRRLPTNWSCTTGHCTLYACTQRLYTLYTPVRDNPSVKQNVIYNWELFRYITRASTNVQTKKAFSNQISVCTVNIHWWEERLGGMAR